MEDESNMSDVESVSWSLFYLAKSLIEMAEPYSIGVCVHVRVCSAQGPVK